MSTPLPLQKSNAPSPRQLAFQFHQNERFSRRHTVNGPPLLLLHPKEERAPPPSRAAKRATMDFSLLAAPLPDPLLDTGNRGKAADSSLDGETPAQVPFVPPPPLLLHQFWVIVVQSRSSDQFLKQRTKHGRTFREICTIISRIVLLSVPLQGVRMFPFPS